MVVSVDHGEAADPHDRQFELVAQPDFLHKHPPRRCRAKRIPDRPEALRTALVSDRLAATVPDLRGRRQGDAAVRASLAYNWRVSLRDLTAKVPGATAGFRPGDPVPGVPTRCNMSHKSQFGLPPETEWDD